jgi:hypothetical protein
MIDGWYIQDERDVHADNAACLEALLAGKKTPADLLPSFGARRKRRFRLRSFAGE